MEFISALYLLNHIENSSDVFIWVVK